MGGEQNLIEESVFSRSAHVFVLDLSVGGFSFFFDASFCRFIFANCVLHGPTRSRGVVGALCIANWNNTCTR
jgi:hypothetical protein